MGVTKVNRGWESIIINGNRQNCEIGPDWKANEIWNFGKLIGILGREEDSVVLGKLQEMEARDKIKRIGKNKHTCAVGDLAGVK